jgi:hypothetical protein
MNVTGQRERSAHLPPRWFIRMFWVVERAAYRVTGGWFGLRTATADRWGMMRLRTVGRRSGKERTAILGHFEDGPDLVTMVADIVGTEGVADIAKRRQDGARLGATRPDS